MNRSRRSARAHAMHESARRRARQLRLLQNVSHEIAAALEVETVLDRLVRMTHTTLGYQTVAAALIEGDQLVFRSVATIPGITPPPHPDAIPLDGLGITTWAARNAEPLLVGDVGADPRYRGPVEFAATRSELAVPLIGRAGVLGVLDLQSDRPNAFDRHDLELVKTLSEYAATAIENARLYMAEQERRREIEAMYEKERLLVADIEDSYNELLHTLNELQLRDEQLERTARLHLLGELASGVAHDFNNLLAGILGNTQLLLLDEDNAERRHMLSVIEQAAQDGAATVRRIQEFARQSEHHAHDPVSLVDVIDGALAITRPRWRDTAQRERRPIQVRRELDRKLMVIGNAAELRELLINLIVNAIDAMPEGGELALRLSQQIEHLTTATGTQLQRLALIEVADSGVGVPPVLRERIFESFYTTKPAGKGSGLGLAICRSIAARHGGRIELDSTVGKGTTFRVLIPLYELAAPPSALTFRPAAAETRRILVVDDDQTVRDVLGRILQRAGHDVTCAANDEEALAAFALGRYDLLFTDLSMPGMGGAALLSQILALDPQIAAVVITGWGQIDDVQTSVPGALAVVAKPFSAAQILDLVGGTPRRDAV
jgi:signal transduction histidine kinase